jgi:chromosomal replication initiator protein DnaA
LGRLDADGVGPYATSIVNATDYNTVFISYSRESQEHTEWVRRLADAVEEMPGFHVVFDQYDLHAGLDLTAFMDRGIACSRIIIVITPEYVRRAEQRLGGVGYESSVISANHITDQLSDRCVPVLKSGGEHPAFLRSKMYVDFRPPISFEAGLQHLRQALLRITPAERPPKTPSERHTTSTVTTDRSDTGAPTGGDNAAYTFSSFLVSAGSDLAFSACVAVADAPGRIYNPLFLYGPTGCGKTHLLHAIDSHMRARQRNCRILRLRTEAFVDRLINSIRFDKLAVFREALSRTDVLLLDDIEYISGKERTQEELFNRFSDLLLRDTQMVFTCSVPPREITNVEERVLVQFEGGLVAEIRYPDQQVLVQIARNMAISRGARIPDDMLRLIARRSSGNPRDVQSLITRVTAERALFGAEDVDLSELVSKLLRKRGSGDERSG